MVIAPVRRKPQIPPVEWRTPTPLWLNTGDAEDANLFQPTLLRFASDSFMEDFIALAQTKSERMREWCARKETWRLPAPTPELRGDPLPADVCKEVESSLPEELQGIPLKLFQPAHERYYLVTTSLVCRIRGLPDKFLNNRERESVSFVMRRLMRRKPGEQHGPTNPFREHAFVDGMWAEVPAGAEYRLFPNEEEYALFPTTYFDDIDDMPRRLFAGLIPVSNREKFLNAGRAPVLEQDSQSVSDESKKAQRIAGLLTAFDAMVLQPWREIKRKSRRAGEYIANSVNDPGLGGRFEGAIDVDDLITSAKNQLDQLQVSSWLVMLDLAQYLRLYLPDIWAELDEETTSLTGDQHNLWKTLRGAEYFLKGSLLSANEIRAALLNPTDPLPIPQYLEDFLRIIMESAGKVNLAERLWAIDVKDNQGISPRTQLEKVLADYSNYPAEWPQNLEILLSDPTFAELVPLSDEIDEEDEDRPLTLEELVENALWEVIETINVPTPQTPLSAQIAAATGDNDYADDLFVIRCVFKRPCWLEPLDYVVSEPTREFQMASYFDPDAPTRAIRIPMPIDTSPAGLRKFAKNTMFVLSDTLACQVEAARTLTFGDLVLSVLPWPFHKDLPDVSTGKCKTGSFDMGMLCTLSIPIVTICALILLIIIVQLLDVIFKWIPYLIFCLPIPGLKAKEN